MAIITNVIKKMKDEKFTQFIDGELVVGGTVIDIISDPGMGGPSMIPVAAYASAIDGTGWTLTNSDTLEYQAWAVLDATVTPVVGDFSGKWYRRKGLPGVDATATNGADGQPAGFRVNFSTNTAAAKPTAGIVRFNNSNISLATEMYLDELMPSGIDLSGFVNQWVDGGFFMLRLKTANVSTLAVFELTANPVDNDDWFTVAVTNRAMSSSTFADGDECTFQYFGGGGGSAEVTEAAILAATPAVRVVEVSAGISELRDPSNAAIKPISPVYKLPSITITDINDIPAANTFLHGAVVKLHQDNLVGQGINSVGIYLQADAVNNVWLPFGHQLLFWNNYGTFAAPTNSLTAAGKFDLGAGGDIVFPANLFHVGSKIKVFFRYRKLGTTTPTLRIHLGTDLSVRTNNSLIYSQSPGASANTDMPARSEVTFISTTSAIATNRAADGGGGGASSSTDAETLINTAAAMKLTFEASTLASDTVYLIECGAIWIK